MKKYIPFIKLIVASFVLIVAVNFVDIYAARPSSGYPNGQPSIWNIGENINSRTGSFLVGSSGSPTSGTKLDVYGTLTTNGIVSNGNASITGNLTTKGLSISNISTSTTPERLCLSNTGQVVLCAGVPQNTSHGVAIFNTPENGVSGHPDLPGNTTWQVPSSGVYQVTVEVWGAGGAGYVGLTSNNQEVGPTVVQPNNSTISSTTGSSVSISAYKGLNATSTAGGTGGSGGVRTGTRSTIGVNDIRAGGNGSGAPNAPTPSIYQCNYSGSPTQYLVYGNTGGGGAIGGAAYLGSSSSTPGGVAPILNNLFDPGNLGAYNDATRLPLDFNCLNMNFGNGQGSWFDIARGWGVGNTDNSAGYRTLGGFWTNSGHVEVKHGVLPGGGGSTPGAPSGVYGTDSASGTPSNYLDLSSCKIGVIDLCKGLKADNFVFRFAGGAGSHQINKAYGGGAGGYVKTSFPVTAGETFNITVGNGGRRNYGYGCVPNGCPQAGLGAPGQIRITW